MREAWTHEAHDFTPWLAENLDRLAEAIGVPLELQGREVGVGRYSADILAANPADGTLVLIENQLEPSDHTHLGQILTYLAGTEADTVVWLSPQFREEHLSAIRWLNQHSAERYSFFAVRLRVVQIADSPLAPLFEVVEKPNSWERRLQRKVGRDADDPARTADATRRDMFWERYALIDPEVADDQRIAKGSVRWRAIPEVGLVVSRYLSKNNVGLFLRGPRGQSGSDVHAYWNRIRRRWRRRSRRSSATPITRSSKRERSAGTRRTTPTGWPRRHGATSTRSGASSRKRNASVGPSGVACVRLGADDVPLMRALNAVFADAFEDVESYAAEPPDDAYLRGLLAKEHVLALVAVQDDAVIGGLVAYELDKFERARREIYLYDLAVAEAHRRRGVATALIERLRAIAAERGAWVVYVQADHGDEPAIALYMKLGAREDVLHFDIAPARVG